MILPIDYSILQFIWWFLFGVLFLGFVVMDGFDLGVATLLPFIGKTDNERRVMINTIGPVWEGNQVWLILAAGAIFAAWPLIYSVLFSTLYIPLFFVLSTLIIRPLGFKFRSKINSQSWRFFWDKCLFISGLVPALSFGLVLGTFIEGLPFRFTEDMRIIFEGHPLTIVTPFSLISGVLWLCLLMTHGGIYLSIKTKDKVQMRSENFVKKLFFINFVMLSFWAISWNIFMKEYSVTDSTIGLLKKKVSATNYLLNDGAGGFLDFINATIHQTPHITYFIVVVAVLVLLSYLLMRAKKYGMTFILSGLTMASCIAYTGILRFPFILPSTIDPNHSLTVWDSSSSHLTLFIMLVAALIFVPIVLSYTSWVYYVLRGPVQEKDIIKNEKEVY